MHADAALDADGHPAIVENASGKSPVLLVCEHASRHIPAVLDDLGLPPRDLERHVAWDIGAEFVARELSRRLDAPLVLQRYSRLVYDCNRPPDSPGAIPETSETTRIPGNAGLSAAERQARIDRIYLPFHATIERILEQRAARGIDTILVTVHSFTPVYNGRHRSVQLGILHDVDRRLADRLLDVLSVERDILVRRNEPYGPADGVTHTLVLHSRSRNLLNVMIEIRNDLITDPTGQRQFGELLAGWITAALADIGAHGAGRAGQKPHKARHA